MKKENKVLLVEDDSTIRDLIRYKPELDFFKTNFVFDSAENIRIAIKKLRTNIYSAILLDLVLPDSTNGLKTFEIIKRFAGCSPVVVISGHPELAVACIERGAQDFIPKPLNISSVHRSLRYAIERKKVETCLIDRERKYRRIIETTHASIYEINFKNNKIVYANDMMSVMTGYTKKEIFNMKPEDLLTNESKFKWVKRLDMILRGEEVSRTTEYDVVVKSGEIRTALVTAYYNRDRNGIPESANVIALDITERKRAEKRLKLVLEVTSDGIWDVDCKTGKIYYNKKYHTMLGYNVGDLEYSQDQWFRLIHPEDRDKIRKLVDEYENESDRNKKWEAIFRMRHKDGSYKWIKSRGHIVEWDINDQPVRIVGVHIDITKEMENAFEIEKELDNRLKEWKVELKKNNIRHEEKINQMNKKIKELEVKEYLGRHE